MTLVTTRLQVLIANGAIHAWKIVYHALNNTNVICANPLITSILTLVSKLVLKDITKLRTNEFARAVIARVRSVLKEEPVTNVHHVNCLWR